MAKLREGSARELKGHVRNANKGTARGAVQIEDSIKSLGYGRSIVVDKNGVAIAGNHVLDVAQEHNAPIRVVETNGRELVVVKRTDLDIEQDAKAIELAVADNRASEVGLEWDPEILRAEMEAGLQLGKYWRDDELEKLLKVSDEDHGGEGDDSPKESQKPHVVSLAFNDEQFTEFERLSKHLLGEWDVFDTTTVILEALRRCAR